MRTTILYTLLLIAGAFLAACGDVEGHLPPEGTIFPQDRVITGGGGDYGRTPTGGTSPEISPGMRATVDGRSLSVGEANVQAFSSPLAGITQVSAVMPDGSGTSHTLNLGFQTATGEYNVIGLEAWLVPPPDFSSAGVQYLRGETGTGSGTGSTAATGTLVIREVADQRVVGTYNGQVTVDGEPLSVEAEFNVPRTSQPL